MKGISQGFNSVEALPCYRVERSTLFRHLHQSLIFLFPSPYSSLPSLKFPNNCHVIRC